MFRPSRAQVVAIAAGYYHNLALLADHTVVAWGLENTVPASATNVVAIAGGWWHSLALRADGSVVAWGDNSYGQCAVPAVGYQCRRHRGRLFPQPGAAR